MPTASFTAKHRRAGDEEVCDRRIGEQESHSGSFSVGVQRMLV
jgi:hypothetical protein